MGKMNARKKDSPKLKRLAGILSTGNWQSTYALQVQSGLCAVSTAISELRTHGYDIDCRRKGQKWEYKMIAEG